MLPLLGSLLARPALVGALGLAVAAGVQTVRLHVAQGQRERARAEVALTRADLEHQSRAIAMWRAKAEAQARQAAEAAQAAAMARQRHAVELRRLLEAPVPADCAGAVEWAAETAGKLADGWRQPRGVGP